MGAWEAKLAGYVVHLGPWLGHVADLGGHLVAKRAAESQHEHPEAEKCRFLVDVAQKLSNKFCAAESQHEQPEAEKCRFLVDIAQKLSNKFW